MTSLRALLALGRELHAAESEAGNVAVLAQVLAGAQQHPALAAAAKHSLTLWIDEIEAVLVRLLKDSPLAEVTDPAGLARGISASFVGIELYEGVDPAGAESALASLETLGLLVEVVDDLGPVARRLCARASGAPPSRRARPRGMDVRASGLVGGLGLSPAPPYPIARSRDVVYAYGGPRLARAVAVWLTTGSGSCDRGRTTTRLGATTEGVCTLRTARRSRRGVLTIRDSRSLKSTAMTHLPHRPPGWFTARKSTDNR